MTWTLNSERKEALMRGSGERTDDNYIDKIAWKIFIKFLIQVYLSRLVPTTENKTLNRIVS